MQKWTPNVAGIIEHAREIHPKTEIISRLVSGEIHRSNYEKVCIRSRKLASALEKDGVKKGDVIATLALNTYRHLEISNYRGYIISLYFSKVTQQED